MPRSISSPMLTALSASVLQPAIFVEAEFASETIRVWTGYGPITWAGHAWQGLGTLASISPIEEGDRVEARGIVLGLAGFDSSLLSSILGEFKLGKPVTVYLGLFNNGVLIANPITSWAGRLDQPTVSIDGATASISINCESRLLDMNNAVDRRYTAEDQQRQYPGDLGLSFVSSIQEKPLFFGVSPSKS